MIRIDAVWLATQPLDMRAGTDSALARVVAVFGAAHPHTAYLFANKRANRMKVLVHDGIGIWLAARRLSYTRFVALMPCCAVVLAALFQTLKGACTGLAIADSTPLAVGDNLRNQRHSVFKGIAQRGKSSTG